MAMMVQKNEVNRYVVMILAANYCAVLSAKYLHADLSILDLSAYLTKLCCPQLCPYCPQLCPISMSSDVQFAMNILVQTVASVHICPHDVASFRKV